MSDDKTPDASPSKDIVERLRDFVNYDEDEWLDQMLEAADEIERLRAALFKARDYIAAEQTLDRPKAATLEIIDRALHGERG